LARPGPVSGAVRRRDFDVAGAGKPRALDAQPL
jgi:hypothetical protein